MLQLSCPEESMVVKLCLHNDSLQSRFSEGPDIGDLIYNRESQYLTRPSTRKTMKDTTKVTRKISSVIVYEEDGSTLASVNTMQEQPAPWENVTASRFEKKGTLKS